MSFMLSYSSLSLWSLYYSQPWIYNIHYKPYNNKKGFKLFFDLIDGWDLLFNTHKIIKQSTQSIDRSHTLPILNIQSLSFACCVHLVSVLYIYFLIETSQNCVF